MARGRSPNYPAVGLREAIDLVGKLYAAERRTPVSYELAAHAIGYKALSGPARVKVSTLRKYGLVDETAGTVRVSDLALQILYPSSPEQKQAAIEQAASKPDLFRELVPLAEGSDANLTNRLVQMGFTEQGAKQALVAFRETVSLVGGQNGAYDGSTNEEPPMIDAGTPPPATPPASAVFGTLLKPKTEAAAFTWLLPKGVRVELRFAGGPFTKEGLSVLRKYLDVMEQAISEDEPPATPDPGDANDSEPPA